MSDGERRRYRALRIAAIVIVFAQTLAVIVLDRDGHVTIGHLVGPVATVVAMLILFFQASKQLRERSR